MLTAEKRLKFCKPQVSLLAHGDVESVQVRAKGPHSTAPSNDDFISKVHNKVSTGQDEVALNGVKNRRGPSESSVQLSLLKKFKRP